MAGYADLAIKDYYEYFYNSFLATRNSLPINNLWVVFIDNIPSGVIDIYKKREPNSPNLNSAWYDTAAKLASTNRGVIIAQGIKEVGDGIKFSREGYSNTGYLKGILGNGRNDLNQFSISLLETDVSFVDYCLRPWTVALSYEGLTNANLVRSTITVVHLGKVGGMEINNVNKFSELGNNQKDAISRTNTFAGLFDKIRGFLGGTEDSTQVFNSFKNNKTPFRPRKIFTYYNCFPVNIGEMEYNYTGDDVVKLHSVGFGYTSYTIENAASLFLDNTSTDINLMSNVPIPPRSTPEGGFFEKLKNGIMDKAKGYVAGLENQLVGGITNSVESMVTDSVKSLVNSAESVGIGIVNGINTKVGSITGSVSNKVAEISSKLATNALNVLDISKSDNTSIKKAVGTATNDMIVSNKLKQSQKKVNSNDNVDYIIKNIFSNDVVPTDKPVIKPIPSSDTPTFERTLTNKPINQNDAILRASLNPVSDVSGKTINQNDYVISMFPSNAGKNINENDFTNSITLNTNNKIINQNDAPNSKVLNIPNKSINNNDAPNSKNLNVANKSINQNDAIQYKLTRIQDKTVNGNDTPSAIKSNEKIAPVNDVIPRG